jgi:molybdopterin-containing oxidoreductase family membrane subunit
MRRRIVYRETVSRGPALSVLLAGLAILLGLGLISAWMMEHEGHIITGMTNHVVWGTPHVVAVFLIVAASGALNVASIGSVFGCAPYKPLSRLSGLLAIALLVGGLAVLVLDLGRPDRLIVAMTYYNFKSIFAWNIFLYVGFLVVVAAYLFVQMERRLNRYAGGIGLVAFVWRLVLTTGTGSIFGFLVAREAYDTAVMAPLFIAMSLSFGLAIFLLVLIAVCRFGGRDLGEAMLERLARLLGIFAAAVLYFAAVQHLTNLYAAEHGGVEKFLLMGGGIYTVLLWIGQVFIGGLVPIGLIFFGRGIGRIVLSSLAVIAGGLAQVYVIIIGGQAYPLVLFPDMEITSGFGDGSVASYSPSAPEIGLGLGGVALTLIVIALALRVLRLLPASLADQALDPHQAASVTN